MAGLKSTKLTAERCYLCGTKADKLTRDHVPPKGLFPKPRPSDLQTVPCCFPCNNDASRDAEYFRLAASSLINTNAQGRRVWKRVLESTLKSGRIEDLIADLRKGIRSTISAQTRRPGAMRMDAWAENITRVLVRTTRGFLWVFHPEIDGATLDFHVVQINQFCEDSLEKSGVAGLFTEYSRGDGVYRHWRALATDNPGGGMWVHSFYGPSMWMVTHQRGDGRITIEGATGWEQRLTSPKTIKDV